MAVPDFSDSVQPDVQGVELVWRKSSRSNYQGNCVELALAAEAVAFRDSKNPEGPILTFPSSSLATFLARC